MTREEAEAYAKDMTYRDAVYNALQGRAIPYRKATLIKLYELLDRLEQEPDDFAKWVAREIFDDEWEYNKDAFAEIACRKLAKLGIVIRMGDEWELIEQEPCDVFDKYGSYKYPSDVELTEPNTATSMPCENGTDNVDYDIRQMMKNAVVIKRSLCDSCVTKGCIFQSGIVRSHCDFYKAESEDKMNDKKQIQLLKNAIEAYENGEILEAKDMAIEFINNITDFETESEDEG